MFNDIQARKQKVYRLILLLVSFILLMSCGEKVNVKVTKSSGKRYEHTLPYRSAITYLDNGVWYIFLRFETYPRLFIKDADEALYIYLYGKSTSPTKVDISQVDAFMFDLPTWPMLGNLEAVDFDYFADNGAMNISATLVAERVWPPQKNPRQMEISFKNIPIERTADINGLCEYAPPNKRMFKGTADWELIEMPEWLSNVGDLCEEKDET